MIRERHAGETIDVSGTGALSRRVSASGAGSRVSTERAKPGALGA
jgi:hypothetical protein